MKIDVIGDIDGCIGGTAIYLINWDTDWRIISLFTRILEYLSSSVILQIVDQTHSQS